MSENNIIREYETLEKANGNTERSRANRIRFLQFFSRTVGKPLDEVTEQDILNFLGRDIKQGTRNNYIENLKHFYTWLDRRDLVKHLKQRPVDDFIDSKDLLTEQEVQTVIDACYNPRDKCLVALLFDLAIERKCIPALNIGDVEVNGDKVFVVVQGKRRGNRSKRRLRCINSTPYVIDWLKNHPFKNNPEAPLFFSFSCNSYGKRVSYGYPYETLKLLAKRAGLQKKVWTHLVRHSKLTDLYRKGFRGVQLQRYAGWTNSNMEQRYVNLAPEEMDEMRITAEKGGEI
jgi:integrase/recombinase XerD